MNAAPEIDLVKFQFLPEDVGRFAGRKEKPWCRGVFGFYRHNCEFYDKKLPTIAQSIAQIARGVR